MEFSGRKLRTADSSLLRELATWMRRGLKTFLTFSRTTSTAIFQDSWQHHEAAAAEPVPKTPDLHGPHRTTELTRALSAEKSVGGPSKGRMGQKNNPKRGRRTDRHLRLGKAIGSVGGTIAVLRVRSVN